MSACWDEVWQEVDKVQSLTSGRHGSELAEIREAISLYIEAFGLTPTMKQTPAGILQQAFLSQALNTMLLGFDAMRNGFYYQAISMSRFLLECWATFWYLEAVPNEAERWFVNNANKRPPNVQAMLQRMEHPTSDTKAKALSHRSLLNRFSHSDSAAISHLVQPEGDNTVVHWGVTYDEGKFQAACVTLIVWTGNLLDAVARSVPPGHDWHRRHGVTSQTLVGRIESLQKRMGEGQGG